MCNINIIFKEGIAHRNAVEENMCRCCRVVELNMANANLNGARAYI